MPNALAVVAHHDDHLLWMGATIRGLKAKGWTWMLVAMCAPAKAREEYFDGFWSKEGVASRSLRFEDYMGPHEFARNRPAEMRMALLNSVEGEDFDVVFTHSRSPSCEYTAHANHREVEQVVTSLVHSNLIGRGRGSLVYL